VACNKRHERTSFDVADAERGVQWKEKENENGYFNALGEKFETLT